MMIQNTCTHKVSLFKVRTYEEVTCIYQALKDLYEIGITFNYDPISNNI